MTELIDEFQSKYPKGRNKALTLLILTSVGSLGKLAFTCLMWYMIFRYDGFKYMDKQEKFLFITVNVIFICGLLNAIGGLLMFKRKLAGIWLYVVSQLITVLIITWCTLAVKDRLREEEQLFLLITYGVTVVYVVLYLMNRKYWSTRKTPL